MKILLLAYKNFHPKVNRFFKTEFNTNLNQTNWVLLKKITRYTNKTTFQVSSTHNFTFLPRTQFSTKTNSILQTKKLMKKLHIPNKKLVALRSPKLHRLEGGESSVSYVRLVGLVGLVGQEPHPVLGPGAARVHVYRGRSARSRRLRQGRRRRDYNLDLGHPSWRRSGTPEAPAAEHFAGEHLNFRNTFLLWI